MDELVRVVERLVGEPPAKMTRLAGGRNSPVHLVELRTGKRLVLKHYADRARMMRESAALRFMAAAGVARVPRELGLETRARVALHEFLDGRSPTHLDRGDHRQLLAFVDELQSLRHRPDAARLPEASEACFRLEDLEADLGIRRARLLGGEARGAGRAGRGLRDLLDDEFPPLLETLTGRARELAATAGVDLSARLAPGERILSPSDLGFHNTLRLESGRLAFLDFEHFGWDDPAKAIADFVLHPGMRLARAHRRWIAQRLATALPGGRRLRARLLALFPLLALKWSLILLNEFLPRHAARRATAGALGDPEEARVRQLSKALAMLRVAARAGAAGSLEEICAALSPST